MYENSCKVLELDPELKLLRAAYAAFIHSAVMNIACFPPASCKPNHTALPGERKYWWSRGVNKHNATARSPSVREGDRWLRFWPRPSHRKLQKWPAIT